MSRQEELNRLINNIASDLEGFMGASVVDVETGMSARQRLAHQQL